MRRPTFAPLLAVTALAPLLLAGCGQVQDAAETAATNAATRARDDATNKLKNAAQEQAAKTVCQLVDGDGPLTDGAVSDQDRVLVASADSLAKSADLPARYTAALTVLAAADSGKQAQVTAVEELRTACA